MCSHFSKCDWSSISARRAVSWRARVTRCQSRTGERARRRAKLRAKINTSTSTLRCISEVGRTRRSSSPRTSSRKASTAASRTSYTTLRYVLTKSGIVCLCSASSHLVYLFFRFHTLTLNHHQTLSCYVGWFHCISFRGISITLGTSSIFYQDCDWVSSELKDTIWSELFYV